MTEQDQSAATAAAPVAPPHRRGVLVLTGAAGALAVVGLVGLARMGFWYALDNGADGSAAVLHEHAAALRALSASAAGLAIGVALFLARRHVARQGVALVAVASLGALGLGGLAAVSPRWYPDGSRAQVVALDPATGREIWRTSTAATQLWGVRTIDDMVIVVEGRVDRRSCDWYPVALTIARSSGRILDSTTLPSAYPDQARVPPEPAPPPPGEIAFRQGGRHKACPA